MPIGNITRDKETGITSFQIVGSNSPELNRQRVSNNEAVNGYIEQEGLIKSWWHGYMPPKNLRFGDLPTIPSGKGTAPKYMSEEWYSEGSRGL